jgi:general secretion pathway protein K
MSRARNELGGQPARTPRRHRQRGSALLAVLWLSVALSAIAFALSQSVRTELERAGLNVDSTKAYFLARGAIERTMMYMVRPVLGPNDPAAGFRPGQNWMHFNFPSGTVDVEIEGEGGKLDVNSAPPEGLAAVLAASGLDPSVAVAAAAGIVQIRQQTPWSIVSSPAGANITAPPTFSSPGASFQELEELLAVPGITPDILYGSYARNQQGQLARVGGLYRHLTVFGSQMIDANYASPVVLRAAGLAEGTIAGIMQIRATRPLQPQDGLSGIAQQVGPLRLGLVAGSRAYTLRATARLHQGHGVRTVAAMVRMAQQPTDPPIRVMRWHDVDF